MANPKQSKSGSPLQSTRQMLDELDSLMERMLSLPVGDTEELPPLPRDVRKTGTVSASLSAVEEMPAESHDVGGSAAPAVMEAPAKVPTMEEPSEPREDLFGEVMERPPVGPLWREMSDESDSQPEPSRAAEPPAPGEMPGDRSDSAEEMNEPHFRSESFEAELPPPLVIARPIQIVTSPEEPAETSRVSEGNLFLSPFIWANQSFDACTTWLGPLGRSLRASRGRTFLGIIGIVCLSVAGAWLVLDHVGWPR